jgi:hypothetical protein
MNTKTIFQYRIREHAYETMVRILRNPEVTGPEINGQICRVTTTHDVLLSIKSFYWPEFRDDELVQVRLQDNNSREFVVMKSFLDELDEA